MWWTEKNKQIIVIMLQYQFHTQMTKTIIIMHFFQNNQYQ